MSLENWALVIATLLAPTLAVVVRRRIQHSKRNVRAISMKLQIRVQRR